MIRATPPSYPRSAEVKRLIKAVQACGVPIGSVSIAVDGTILLTPVTNQPPRAVNDFDRLLEAGQL